MSKDNNIIIKVKSDKILLEMLLKHAKLWIGKKALMQCSGLCSVIYCMYDLKEIINEAESQRLYEILRNNPHPIYKATFWYWKPWIQAPRIEWLEELIKTMKEIRSTKILLELLLVEVRKEKKEKELTGLCRCIAWLHHVRQIINEDEMKHLFKLIKNVKHPRAWFFKHYYWYPGRLWPRVRFIKKLMR